MKIIFALLPFVFVSSPVAGTVEVIRPLGMPASISILQYTADKYRASKAREEELQQNPEEPIDRPNALVRGWKWIGNTLKKYGDNPPNEYSPVSPSLEEQQGISFQLHYQMLLQARKAYQSIAAEEANIVLDLKEENFESAKRSVAAIQEWAGAIPEEVQIEFGTAGIQALQELVEATEKHQRIVAKANERIRELKNGISAAGQLGRALSEKELKSTQAKLEDVKSELALAMQVAGQTLTAQQERDKAKEESRIALKERNEMEQKLKETETKLKETESELAETQTDRENLIADLKKKVGEQTTRADRATAIAKRTFQLLKDATNP